MLAEKGMRCGVALGSNLGDRLANLREAFARISLLHHGIPEIAASSIYETSPVDCEPGSASYLNAVIEMNFEGPPVALLDKLLSIERQMGRPSKRPRNAPRRIDLDVLYVGNRVLNNPEIIIPHPRLSQRRFVLLPLSEIAADLILPGQTVTVRALLNQLQDPGVVTPINERLERHE
jgi:2-amino-4-hydroxy-6-hydroxymethyldihydropteridine diphosphokinase